MIAARCPLPAKEKPQSGSAVAGSVLKEGWL